MNNKNIGFTIGKFAPLHKGHQYLIETALNEMDEMYVVIYDTDITKVSIQKRAKWLKRLYPQVHIIYAFNSPKKYGLDEESVNIQMNYLYNLIKDVPVTHFYCSELYGKKVADFLNIKNRIIDLKRKKIPITAEEIRKNYYKNSNYLEDFILQDCQKEEKE